MIRNSLSRFGGRNRQRVRFFLFARAKPAVFAMVLCGEFLFNLPAAQALVARHASTNLASTNLVGDSKLVLDKAQTLAFRAWYLEIVKDQIKHGPNPRWINRDCAGLIRFAATEALRSHDEKWRKANRFFGRATPPEVALSKLQASFVHRWDQGSGQKGAYVSALGLIRNNSTFVSKDLNDASPGDLLFFDQGDDQHLMVWTGQSFAYHTGSYDRTHDNSHYINDNGLKNVSLQDLMNWKDTRWQPRPDNPNFIGFFRFDFLTH